jgi:hypothetical protein
MLRHRTHWQVEIKLQRRADQPAQSRYLVIQGNRASEAFDECSQEVIAPSCLFELHAV